MNVYLINLAANVERFQVAREQLDRLQVPFERIDAVYGKDLSVDERRRNVNRFRWWCAIGRPIVPAEIGCAMSHADIYRRMIQEDIPFACILEDDVMLTSDFPKQLSSIESWIDARRAQVILLSNHTGNVCNDWGIQPSRNDYCTEGYVLTQAAAGRLLKANWPMQTPCDHWGRWVRAKRIELYHAFPTVCSQDQATFGSSTSENRTNLAKMNIFRYGMHKMKRLIGKMIDRVCCSFGI